MSTVAKVIAGIVGVFAALFLATIIGLFTARAFAESFMVNFPFLVWDGLRDELHRHHNIPHVEPGPHRDPWGGGRHPRREDEPGIIRDNDALKPLTPEEFEELQAELKREKEKGR